MLNNKMLNNKDNNNNYRDFMLNACPLIFTPEMKERGFIPIRPSLALQKMGILQFADIRNHGKAESQPTIHLPINAVMLWPEEGGWGQGTQRFHVRFFADIYPSTNTHSNDHLPANPEKGIDLKKRKYTYPTPKQ